MLHFRWATLWSHLDTSSTCNCNETSTQLLILVFSHIYPNFTPFWSCFQLDNIAIIFTTKLVSGKTTNLKSGIPKAFTVSKKTTRKTSRIKAHDRKNRCPRNSMGILVGYFPQMSNYAGIHLTFFALHK